MAILNLGTVQNIVIKRRRLRQVQCNVEIVLLSDLSTFEMALPLVVS